MRPARARHAGGNAFYVAGPRYNFALRMHIEGFLCFVLARCALRACLAPTALGLLGVKKIRSSCMHNE